MIAIKFVVKNEDQTFLLTVITHSIHTITSTRFYKKKVSSRNSTRESSSINVQYAKGKNHSHEMVIRIRNGGQRKEKKNEKRVREKKKTKLKES